MGLFDQKFKLGFKGKLYENLADPGSMLFGGAGVSNSLGQRRDEKKQGIDWFGSPVTAGTDAQDAARLGAILYGGWAGLGAAGAAGAGSAGGGAAAGEAGALGAGATGAGTAGAYGAGASGAAGGSAATAAPFGGFDAAAVGGGTYGAGAAEGGAIGGGSSGGASYGGSSGSSPGWQRFLPKGGMGGGQQQQYQPQWQTIPDEDAQRLLLARLLMERGNA